MYIRDIIKKKRQKQELTEEIRFFIFNYYKGNILEVQAAALLTLMFTNGITQKEMAYFTNAMAETGKELELYKISNQIVDIHPIGGIQDKIILIVMSMIASLGIPIAKIEDARYGLEDRLLAISNYNTDIDMETLKEQIKNTKMGIMAKIINIALVEEKLYQLRHEIACDGDISLITMSLMSQKVAIGARNIIFNITFGEEAYVKTYRRKKMSDYLIRIGKQLNKNVKCIISNMKEPIGNSFGNLLEINEVINCLKNQMDEDVREYVFTIY